MTWEKQKIFILFFDFFWQVNAIKYLRMNRTHYII